MVVSQNKNTVRSLENQGQIECTGRASKISASTKYEYCSERLSAFGGLLGLIKFLKLIEFREIFEKMYKPPKRRPQFGNYNMIYSLLILLFIGFNRVWHFLYIQNDPMVCSTFNVLKLPYVTTFWRYVDSLGINQGQSLLQVMSAMRERVWHLCNISLKTIHIDIDTTVNTIFGNQQGGRKGHNTKNRGKKAYRPLLCFISETREYIYGKLRKGDTIGGDEMSKVIKSLKKYIPACVNRVLLRADGEFISWQSVKASIEEGYDFIFGNKVCNPPFDESEWYKTNKTSKLEYNETIYQPVGWEQACRFVAMRFPKKESKSKYKQLELFEENNYEYRIFVTNFTAKPHKAIAEYDKRADCENLVGESKREGLSAVPTGKFSNNYAYFQIVMLAYNIWRSFKMLSGYSQKEQTVNVNEASSKESKCELKEIVDNTIRIARLKLLFIASKITYHSKVYKVKYSEHDSRASGLFKFYEYLDDRIKQPRPWLDSNRWYSKHLSAFNPPETEAA